MKNKTNIKFVFLLIVGNILSKIANTLTKILLNITDEVIKIQQEYSSEDKEKT